MKIIAPTVTLRFVAPDDPAGFDPLTNIEDAGRTSWRSEGKMGPGTAVRFVKMLLARRHESVVEHSFASFRVVCGRGVSHELVRHRIASFTQESTRYVCVVDDRFDGEMNVIEPPGLDGLAREAWLMSCRQAEASYRAMLAQGCKPQIARSVLPTCLRTELVMSANLREWRHFFDLRTDPAAHPQMVEVAKRMLQLIRARVPLLFDEFEHEPRICEHCGSRYRPKE